MEEVGVEEVGFVALRQTRPRPAGDPSTLGTKLEDYTLDPLHRDGWHNALGEMFVRRAWSQ